MSFGHTILTIACILFIGFPAYWLITDKMQERREARKEAAEKAARAEARRNFKRKIYPAIEEDVRSRCGNAPDIPATLDMDESLISDTTALMTCQIIIDGETTHGPSGGWLERKVGYRLRTLADLEKIAAKHANQEWLVKFVQPLQSMVYQRHADGKWNLVRVGTGMF